MDQMTIYGVYTVPDHPEVHLVEVRVFASPENIEVSEFTQEDPSLSRDSWQVAYDEKYLNTDGNEVIGDWMTKPPDSEETRLAFFLHYIHFDRPLLTPYGSYELPPPTPMPERLKGMIEYEEVD